jgi:RimJ/RimL family protein N-acetyltransferase
VTAGCFVGNTPSYRLMERVGMRREQHAVKDALHPTGEWVDGYLYALPAEEWRARHPCRRHPSPGRAAKG